MIKLVILIAVIIILSTQYYLSRSNTIKNKCILILGGTKGLGFELAKILMNNNKVIITGRSEERLKDALSLLNSNIYPNMIPVKGFVYKIDGNMNFDANEFNYIFYIPGISKPGYFIDQNINDFKVQMNVNFFGLINSLYCLLDNKSKPIFVAINSTAALFPYPGYSSYSPSKKAIDTFFEASRLELRLNIKQFFCSGFRTQSFEKENLIKPEFTKKLNIL